MWHPRKVVTTILELLIMEAVSDLLESFSYSDSLEYLLLKDGVNVVLL